ncbi:uncharacterized protein [Diabrotica undecimpunctata]|uniref:uncharacterized protein n=1 Tax=Diabrotica undecimpunctata TaxID=50387 RepID=UPI003B635C13
MLKFLVLVSLLPVLSLCGNCKYSSFSVHCQEISQDDFLIELFRNKKSISTLQEILIEDSDFSRIQPFVDFSNDLNPAKVDISSLTIRRSKVDTVTGNTFGAFRNLYKLNLSQNNITNLDWLPGLFISYDYNYLNLDLSYNKISELDFNNLRQKMSSIWLNNNEISILKPTSFDYTSFDFIDLSNNKLVFFSEFEFKVNIRSLDLSYNYLQKLALRGNKVLLKIEGNGNTNISYIGTSNSYSVSSFYSSFIPNNTLSMQNIFKLNWIDTDLPVLNSNKIPIIRSGIIDFSNNKLTSIPQNYFQSVQASVFNLSFNNFDVLSNKVFGVNSGITTIDLSFSNLKKISNEFFINCCSRSYSYNILDLSHNALEELDGICNRIPQLKHLDLSSNRITNLSQISISNCSHLSSYNISNNFINDIPPETFQIQVPIETLDISENNLLFINESTFRNLKSVLRNIYLRKNNISTIGSKSFCDFDYLKIIDLSDNKIKNIEQYAFLNLKNIHTINLSNNSIELLESYTFNNTSVKNIDLQGNTIHYIREKAFSNLNYLESLNLSNSAIAILENDVFFNLPVIHTIDLSNNYIVLLSNYTFRNLPVRYIFLNGNKIEYILQNAFHNLNNLIEVNLKNNNIEGIVKYSFHLVNVETLLLNSISSPIILDNTVKIKILVIQLTGTVGEQFISSAFLKNLTIIDSHIELLKNNCFVDLPLLTSLNLINTTFDVAEDNIFSELTSLTYLDASQIFQNKVLLKEYTFRDLFNLQVLNISNSALNTIENNAFAGLSELKELHLKGNKLTVVNLTAITNGLSNLIKLNLSSSSIKNVQSSKLGNPNKVKYLDLSNNFIENLDSQTFRLFVNLVELLLHNNELSTIEYQTFYYLKNLKTLRLDNNRIYSLGVGVFAGLENLSFLNISDNARLFSSGTYTSNLLPLETLESLQTLYIDNTSLHRFNTNLKKSFPSLSIIGINNNLFSCNDLINLIIYLKYNNIDYTPYNPQFEVKNLKGLTCAMSFEAEQKFMVELWEMIPTDDENYFDDERSENENDQIEERDDGSETEQGMTDEEEESGSNTLEFIEKDGVNRWKKAVPPRNVRTRQENYVAMKMIKFLVLVSLLPALSLCGGCNYSSYIFQCQGISQDDFLLELFRNKDAISQLNGIVIEDSDFSGIQPFVDFSKDLNPAYVFIKSLTIIRSKVDGVGSDTFGAFINLSKLNLTQNNITNLDWLTGLSSNYYLNLDLSYNKIFELDFNDLGNRISSIWLNNNEISIVKPTSYYPSFDFIDLSHNKLVVFNEFEYNVNIRSLDLSYNYLQMLALKSNKDLLKIEGHGNSNISYIGNSNSYSVSNFYSSFIPNNSLSIRNIFKLNWIDIDLPVLDSNKLPSISSNVIDFSNNNLTSIPQNYFQSVQASVFNLSFNNFDVLSNKVFGVNPVITTIDLSFSNLKKISNEFFINCCSSNSYYFVYVNLSHNALEELDGICTGIPKLKHLDLSSNRIINLSQISILNCSYLSTYNISKNFINDIPPETFQGQVPIETLDISENNLLFINESTFRNLKRVLKTINVRNNNISTVGSKSFDDFDYLRIIDLSDNKIQNIEQYAFSNLKNIDIINLSNNAIELLESYTFNNISVENIDLQGNPIHYIREKAFSNLKYLESLNLSNSAIAILENDVFFNLPAIRTIDLSNNYIDLLSNYTFRNLPVRYIFLNGNKIEYISQNAFHNLNNLIEVNMKNNNIQGIEKYSFHLVDVDTLLLNSISSPIVLDNTFKIKILVIQLTGTVGEQFISSVFLKNLTIIDSHIELLKNNCFIDLPLLTSLNFINTTIDVSEDNIFSGLTSLTYLEASQIFQNKTLLKDYTFKDMRNLEVLNISNSALDTIENNAFAGLLKLKELNLKGNKLSAVNLTAITNDLPNLLTLNLSSSSIKIVQTSKLGSPNNVQYLDLSNNYLTNLDSQTFKLFEDLVELLLHNNELSTIEYQTFYYLKNLRTLRLDNNKISSFSDGVLDGLEGLTFLNISDNKNLFYQNNLVPFQTLRYLDQFYVDNTYLRISIIDVTTFRKTFPRLSKIGINNNQFACIDLLNIMIYFDSYKIDYTPYNPKFDVKNLNGITC